MAVVEKITIKMPRWRVRFSVAVLWVLAPVLSVERGERLASALVNWTAKGLKVK